MERTELVKRILDRLNEITGRSESIPDDRLEEMVFKRLDQTEKIVSSIQRYLPKRVIDKILLNPDGVKVEGERRQVTILFGDLSGFTAMSETMDPEQVVDVVNQYFDTMVEIASRYGGHIDKFMGDALMVLFGAPVAHEDDPLRACLAAIEMLEAMDRFSAERKMDLAMSIGLNTGEVVALNVGSKERMEYTVIGDGVNLAARLEKVATARQCVIGENTFKQVKGKIRLKKLKPVMVKGKSKPQNVYLIQGRLDTEGKAAGLRAGSIKMVGRMAEMEQVRNTVAKARQGQGQAVAITGEPGIGKSRLAKELELMVRDEGFQFIKGKCYSYSTAIAYLPFIRQLNTLLEIGEKDSQEIKKEKLQERLHRFDLGDYEPFLGSLLGLHYAEAEELDPEKRKRKTFEAIQTIYEKSAAKEPLTVAFEDLQWADSLTLELLERLVDHISDKAILICCDYRPELALPFIAKPNVSSLVLTKLDQREVLQMTTALAGVADVSDQVLNKLIERTEGNPLFIEEITKHLLSRRLVKREGENLAATKKFGKMVLPTTVAGVVLGRIDKLAEDVRRTLQYAAVIGKEFDRDILASLSKQAPEHIQGHLDGLEHFEGLLYGKPVEGRKVYEFNSTTTHEAAYGTLLKARRKELHGKVGQTLEKNYRDNLEPHYEDLAHHYYNSTFEDKAVLYLHKAGDKARGLYANGEAIEFYQKGIGILKRSKPTRQNQKDFADLIGTQGTVYRLVGNMDVALKNFNKAVAIAKSIDEYKVKLKYKLESGVVYHILGNVPKALKLWNENYSEATQCNDDFDSAVALGNMGVLYLRTGQVDKALEALKSALTLQGKLHNTKEVVRLTGSLAQALETMGDIEQAVAKLQGALDAAKESNYLEGMALLNSELGRMMLGMGNIEGAQEHSSQSLTIAKRIGDKRNEGLSLANIGTINAMMGKYREAMEYFQSSLRAAMEINDIMQQMYMYINIGCVYQLWGDADKALEHHAIAGQMAQKTGFAVNEIEANRNEGLDYAIISNYGKANEKLRKACEMARAIGDLRMISFSKANLGTLLVSLGRMDEAAGLLKEALDGARQVGDPEVILAVVRGLINLGLAAENPDQAREHIDRALRIASDTQNLREKAYALSSQAQLLLAGGDAEGMAGPLGEAHEINQEVSDKYLQAKIDLLSALKALEQGAYVECENILKDLIPMLEKTRYADLLWQTYHAWAQLYQRQELSDLAREMLEKAKEVVNATKNTLPTEMQADFIERTNRKVLFR